MLDMQETIAIMLDMTKKKTKPPELVSQQIRRLIEQCGITRYRLSKETGIAQSVLSKFMNVEGYTLSLDSIDTLGDYLRWRIVGADKPSRQERQTKTGSRKGKVSG